MSNINIQINGKNIQASPGQTILEVALENGIDIPNLCYDPRLKSTGACRMCLVDVAGQRGPVTACTFEIADGMIIETETDEIRQLRKINLELLFYEHRGSCVTCDENGNCLLQQYAYEYQLSEDNFTACDDKEKQNYTIGNAAIEYSDD